MSVRFSEITLEDLMSVTIARVDGDKGVVILGKESML